MVHLTSAAKMFQKNRTTPVFPFFCYGLFYKWRQLWPFTKGVVFQWNSGVKSTKILCLEANWKPQLLEPQKNKSRRKGRVESRISGLACFGESSRQTLGNHPIIRSSERYHLWQPVSEKKFGGQICNLDSPSWKRFTPFLKGPFFWEGAQQHTGSFGDFGGWSHFWFKKDTLVYKKQTPQQLKNGGDLFWIWSNRSVDQDNRHPTFQQLQDA